MEHEIHIVVIPEKEIHPYADALSIVRINGEQLVINHEWETGDKAVLIPADFFVPNTKPFEFLGGKAKHRRIKPRSIRGVWSEGLMLPVTEFPELDGLPVGTNVMQLLGIERYDFENVFHNPKISTIQDILTPEPPGITTKKYQLLNYKKDGAVLVPGEHVRVTEKIHGCLKYNTKVTLADGTKKTIGSIVSENLVGLEVLGLSDTDQVMPTKVLSVFKHESTKDWLQVKFTKTGISKGGNAFGSIHCTPNHKFLINGEYIQASDIKVGDEVYCRRNEDSLTPVQEQVLLGKLLGDASLRITPNTAFIEFGHVDNQEEYLDWSKRFLGDLDNPWRGEYTSGYGSKIVRARTHGSFRVKKTFESILSSGKKEFSKENLTALGPIALAFWYMDDGSLSHSEGQEDRVSFATCGFSHDTVHNLQDALARLGLDSTIQETEKGPRIRLNSDVSEKFFLLIFPYVCSSMKYKLPLRYRNFDCWDLPEQTRSYKPEIVKQTVLSVTAYSEANVKYDIETETHNFFANDIVVHNSNACYGLVNGKVYIGTRNLWVDWEKSPSPQAKFYRSEGSKELRDWLEANPNKLIYGEVFGWVATLRYGAQPNEIYFRAFDVWDEHRGWCSPPGHLSVPIIFEGAFSEAVIKEFVDGKSLIQGADHIREGVVIEPLPSRHDEYLGRLKFKWVSNDYLAGGF